MQILLDISWRWHLCYSPTNQPTNFFFFLICLSYGLTPVHTCRQTAKLLTRSGSQLGWRQLSTTSGWQLGLQYLSTRSSWQLVSMFYMQIHLQHACFLTSAFAWPFFIHHFFPPTKPKTPNIILHVHTLLNKFSFRSYIRLDAIQ